MLRVTVDLVPFGLEKSKRTLYTMEIGNIGDRGVTYTKSGDPRFSYKVRSIRDDGEVIEHGTVIKGFDRKRPFKDLIKKIISVLERRKEL